MIVCGWCDKATVNRDRCTSCGHDDPERPWGQRGQAVPTVTGRTDPTVIRKRLADAQRALGGSPSIEALAEEIGVAPRTVRRWREMTAP